MCESPNARILRILPRMNTLTTPPLSTLLQRLFADAAASDTQLDQFMAKLTPEERRARMANNSPAEMRAFYARAKDNYLAVSPETGKLLYTLARSSRARSMVEFGTSFGISTLHLAAALQDNGGGRLIGTEFEPTKAARARENLKAAGLEHLVEIREGDAQETLARDLPAQIDLVLLDGAKPMYPAILTMLEPRLKSGALLVADNADASPAYVARVRDPANGYLSVPFAEDVELTLKL
jgi:predicted O-methyltransferase YrrM